MTTADPRGTAYALMSYHYFGRLDFDVWRAKFGLPAGQPHIFADSGAFSVKNAGANIQLRDYAEWVRRWGAQFDAYVSLDVIGDWRATLANQKRMEDMGLTPVPVFHVGSPLDILETEYRDYPYIALGNLGQAGKSQMAWFLQVQKRRPDAVFYGFGVTRPQTIADFPFYTVDSSSVTSSVRYKRISLWNPVRARIEHVAVNDGRAMWRFRALIAAQGGDLSRLRVPTARYWDWLPVSVLGYMKLMHYCRARHGVVAHPRGHGAGLRLYLANTNEAQMASMVKTIIEHGA